MTRKTLISISLLLGLVFLAGCHRDMWIQPKPKPLGESSFFKGGMASRVPPENTIARGELRIDKDLFVGKDGTLYSTEYPFTITRETLETGRQKFDLNCSPCHGLTGNGKGMISQRGLAIVKQPATFHQDRLRNAPVGYFFDVITNGFGQMKPQAIRVEPRDRWAIIAYIRVLQLRENVPQDRLSPEDLNKLTKNDGKNGTQSTGP